jgi:hypothetical protein
MDKITLFKNSFAEKPAEQLTFLEFIEHTKKGKWNKVVLKLRGVKENERSFKMLKKKLPAVTVSGNFSSRDTSIELSERLDSHSGLICIDVDKKDNPRIRVQDLVDKECLAQFVSCSGEGIKIVYRCKKVTDAAEHRRIYDAVALRLERKKIKLKLDPVVKSIASLQYVSFDPELYYNERCKLIIKPLAPVKIEKKKLTQDVSKELEQLNTYIDALGEKDVTKDYESWLLIMFGLSYSLGEHGREALHRLSQNYSGYSELECNEKYDACLEKQSEQVEKPITIATVYQIINDALNKPTLRLLAKKFNKSHAVGVGEDTEHGDLSGMVRYKLFLFKKVFDKDSNTLVELVPAAINLNAFESLLKEKGFFRYGNKFVWVNDNIVEECDVDDILRIVTKHVEHDGNYNFMYKKLEFVFSWEELVHLWRTIRAQGATYNQVSSSLEHWESNLLKDSATHSYIPYQNGVAEITADSVKLIEYKDLTQQIWKERILPRSFKYLRSAGMFEEFFLNVTGRGDSRPKRTKSQSFKRALWYFGYMLQGSKRQSTARAWLLYDIKTGNNGRSGKTIIGTALGKIRSMVVLDGKQIDFRNRFAFQTVQPWTDIVFIDDPSKFMSLNPLFNMISGSLSAEPKGQKPIDVLVKFLIASNWILESEGKSEAGRQFVTQLDDFYDRYSRENGNTITPIVDLHGKEFFTDWDEKDWSQFDSFCARALQYHLKSDAPDNTIIGNSAIVRFIQVHEQELFYLLCELFTQQVRELETGALGVPMHSLIDVIKDTDARITSNTAGRIAREFLSVISNGAEVKLTTVRSGGRVQNLYRINRKLKDLNFGDYK